MTTTVTLFTDRPLLAMRWREALERQGLQLRVFAPEQLGDVPVHKAACVFDASPESYEEDDLLTAVGYVRAEGGVPVAYGEVEDVVEELCGGCVARNEADIARVALAIVRRLDMDRCRRFEFVTVSPTGQLLAILGDGHATLLSRPIDPRDDGSEIEQISLSEDASAAMMALQSGETITVQAASVMPQEIAHAAIEIDGERLGKRLRELRLEAGLTQADLSRRTGIHRPNIARVEAGRHTPSLETLARIAGAIGVPTTRVLAED